MKFNYHKEGECTVYNNFEKQQQCKFYEKSILDFYQIRCVSCRFTLCHSQAAYYDQENQQKWIPVIGGYYYLYCQFLNLV